MPKVSVIIPTYNRANLLPRAIKSVLNQTYPNFEIIIVDDGSTDNTKNVVTEFQKKDNRIKYFYQTHFGGPPKPLNLGIHNAIGEYVTFLGSDDEFSPRYLEKLLKPFESSEKNIDVTSCNVLIIDERSKVLKEISKPKNTNNEYIIKTSLTHNYIFGNIFVKRKMFEKVGFFDENLKICEDFDMWIRLAKSGCKFRFVYEPLYIIHTHPNQISSSVDTKKRIGIANYLFKKYKDLYDKYPKAKSIYFRHISTMYALSGNKNQALKNILLSIKFAPFYLRNYINFFLLLAGLKLFKRVLKLKTQLFPF